MNLALSVEILRKYIFIVPFFIGIFISDGVIAFSLWSTRDTFRGTGEFIGPGTYDKEQVLFEMIFRDVAFTDTSSFKIPYFNNAQQEPNVCGEYDVDESPDGRLSNGLAINEKADMCLANIAGTNMHIAVVGGGELQGQIECLILDQRQLLVSMDIAFDLGIGEKGVIRMPFYGSTDKVKIPYSLQTQLGMPGGSDRAGRYDSGMWLEGQLGDFDDDGWIDGTLVSAGNIPLESPVFPGQPYAMIRHFELDIPVGGYEFGNIKASYNKRKTQLSGTDTVQ